MPENIGIGTTPGFLLNVHGTECEFKDTPAEFIEIVSENFWEIIGGAE